MIAPRLRAAGMLVAVFALGVATGAAGMHYTSSRTLHRLFAGPPLEARRRALLWALDREVSLTREQRGRIEAILAAHNEELVAIARRAEPELAPVMERMHAEMRATLRPDQQGKFDALVAKIQERRRRSLGMEGP